MIWCTNFVGEGAGHTLYARVGCHDWVGCHSTGLAQAIKSFARHSLRLFRPSPRNTIREPRLPDLKDISVEMHVGRPAVYTSSRITVILRNRDHSPARYTDYSCTPESVRSAALDKLIIDRLLHTTEKTEIRDNVGPI